jgi:hypothetical protein
MDTKTVTYHLKFTEINAPFRPFAWKTKGSAWKDADEMPKTLREHLKSAGYLKNLVFGCPDGKRKAICAEVDVTTELSRMGKYIRKRKEGFNPDEF